MDPLEGACGRGTVLGCREPPPLIGPCVSRARTLCLQLTWPGLKTTPRTSKGLQIWVLWHLPEIFHPQCRGRRSDRLASTGRDRAGGSAVPVFALALKGQPSLGNWYI